MQPLVHSSLILYLAFSMVTIWLPSKAGIFIVDAQQSSASGFTSSSTSGTPGTSQQSRCTSDIDCTVASQPYCSTNSYCVNQLELCDTCWTALRGDVRGTNGYSWSVSSDSACSAIPDVSTKCSNWNLPSSSEGSGGSFWIQNGFTSGFYFSPLASAMIASYQGYYLDSPLDQSQLSATTVNSVTSWTSCNNTIYTPPASSSLNDPIYSVSCGLRTESCKDLTYSIALVKTYVSGTREFLITPRNQEYLGSSDSCHVGTILLVILIIVIIIAVVICVAIGACVYWCCCRPAPPPPPPAASPVPVVVVQPVVGQPVVGQPVSSPKPDSSSKGVE